jgi:hypothetical protein
MSDRPISDDLAHINLLRSGRLVHYESSGHVLATSQLTEVCLMHVRGGQEQIIAQQLFSTPRCRETVLFSFYGRRIEQLGDTYRVRVRSADGLARQPNLTIREHRV